MTRTVIVSLLLLSGLVLLASCGDDVTVPMGEDPPGPYLVEKPLVIPSGAYLHDRFFRLDLPWAEPAGRGGGDVIDLSTIRLFELMPAGPARPGDVANIAVYVDSLGCRAWSGLDFTAPFLTGARWQLRQSIAIRNASDGSLRVVDLGAEAASDAVLAVTYAVRDATGGVIRVGDDPAAGAPSQAVDGAEGLFYRMKLLKAATCPPVPHVRDYPLRNVYYLGGANIDPAGFDFRIELAGAGVDPLDETETGIPWFRLFGLDSRDTAGRPGPDGLLDIRDATIFDLDHGLVFFPPDLPQPFAAAAATYEALAAPDQYPYAGSVLARHVTPRIYEPGLSRAEHLAAGRFTMNWTATAMVYPDRPLPGPLSLARPDWMRAAVPRGIDAEPVPAGRTDQVRWFAPRERVQARHLDPDLAGAPGDETVPALELYLRASSGWQAGSWGGIATGLSRTGADLRDARRMEIWLNDGQAERALRSGRLHIDVGYVSEDGFWPETGEGPETGTFQSEDRNFDGVWTLDEDTGLDGAGSAGPEAYASDYVVDGDSPFPRINGTAANNRWDTEDLNGDFLFGRREGYFTFVIDLASARPEVDVVYDYEDTGDLVAAGIAWRRHSINLDAFIPVDVDLAPNRAAVTHLRLWFDDPMRPAGENAVRLQIAGLRFVE